MTTEIISNSMYFEETGKETTWERYGIVQHFGSFSGQPRRYQVIKIQTNKGTQNIVKSPFFIPIPTAIAQQIVHEVAQELNLQIKEEYNDGMRYFATLSSQIKGEVERGDLVAWGIGIRNNVTGSFRIDGFLLRLVCSNGLMEPAESEIANIKKSYNIKEMKDSFLEKAQAFQEKFEEELERFRQFKKYKMNQELAELLAKSFPAPILQDLVTLGKNRVVQNFSNTDLWTAYNSVTYQISHRRLKLSTRFEWSLKATKIFENYIKEQAQTS